jgi:hypothetical protein
LVHQALGTLELSNVKEKVMEDYEAMVNVTWSGSNGDMPDPVSYDSTDDAILQMVTEAVQTGGIPGIPSDNNADFENFVVDRFPATEDRPNRIMVRPKTPFGETC